MLHPSHHTSFPFASRLRSFLYLCLLFGFAQAVTPTNISWLAAPVEAAVTPPVGMNHQPAETASRVQELWSRNARYVEIAATDTAEVDMFHAKVLLGRDSVARFSGGAVNLFVEAGTFTADTTVEFQPILQQGRSRDVLDGSITSYEETYFRFHIDARDGSSGNLVSELERPLRIVVDLDAVGIDLSQGYDNLYLAAQDANDPNLWNHLPFEIHEDANAISADVQAVNNEYTVGEKPEAWGLQWSPPVVSEFSGAVTYGYPIDVPSGRNGLQPSVALSYNSRNMDGLIQSSDAGFVASGWSIAQMGIFRDDVEIGFWSGSDMPMNHPDRFSLVIDGTGYDLELGVGESVANNANTPARYDAVGNPALLVYRHYDSTKKTYWTVSTGSGTVYTFGDTEGSESWQCVKEFAAISIELFGQDNRGIMGGCPTGYNEGSPSGWYLTTVEDQFNNKVVYDYVDNVADIENSDDGLITKEVRIANIYYNHRATDSSVAGSQIAFRPSNTEAIESIYVYGVGNESNSVPMGEYRIATREASYASNACINQDKVPSTPRTTDATLLDSITYHVNVDDDVTTADAGYSLPATTFEYEWYFHHHQGTTKTDPYGCFAFPYLTKYANGYGGSVTYSYESDGRSYGGYGYNGYNDYDWPSIGYSYVVDKVTVHNGFGNKIEVDYEYSGPCYVQSITWAGTQCHTIGGMPEYSALTGYSKTAISTHDLTRDAGDQLVSHVIHEFKTDNPAWIGKPDLVTSGYNNNGDVWTIDTSKVHQVVDSDYHTGLGALFRPIRETISEQRQGSHVMRTKMVYTYDPASQKRVGTLAPLQLGKVTQVDHYINPDGQGEDELESVTRNRYQFKDTGNLRVIRQTANMVNSGTPFTDANTLSFVVNHFDNQMGGNDDRFIKGQLTATYALMPEVAVTCAQAGNPAGCTTVDQAVVTSYSYDGYGNILSQTSYGDYGYWFPGAVDQQLPSNGRTTWINYDTTYQMYPLSTVNPGGHRTEFEYYGVNGVSMNNTVYNGGVHDWQRQRGSLRMITDANQQTAVYEYDPFGRLWQVFDREADLLVLGQDVNPGSNARYFGNPAQRTRYWDNAWEGTVDGNPVTFPLRITNHVRPAMFGTNSAYRIGSSSYFDGMGNVVMTRSWDADVEGVVRDLVTYIGNNGLGQVRCQSTPTPVAPVLHLDGSGYLSGRCLDQSHPTLTTYTAGEPYDVEVQTPDGFTSLQSGALVDSYVNGTMSTNAAGDVMLYQSQEDANNQVKATLTDVLGRMVRVMEFDSSTTYGQLYAETDYVYDDAGNLIHVIDDAGNTSTMTYDIFGRKLTMDDPDMGDWSYEYDAQGNLISQTDGKNKRLCFYYDRLNRMTLKGEMTSGTCPTSEPNDGTANWVWLAKYDYDDLTYYWGEETPNAVTGDRYGGFLGALSRVRWPGVNGGVDYELFAYDDEGRMVKHTRVIDGQSYTMRTVSFDELDRPAVISYPDGELVTMTYDAAGGETLQAGGDVLVNEVVYNEFGQMTQLDRGHDSFVQDTYYDYYAIAEDGNANHGNNMNRLKEVRHGSGLGSGAYNVGDFQYTYDRVGNITSIKEYINSGIQTQNFTYDHLYRLETASAATAQSVPGYSETYTYNEIGNITSRNGVTYNYSPTQPHAVTGIGGQSFAYDANGNMDVRNDNTGSYTHLFDTENRLTEVTDTGSGDTTTFAYDPNGQRTMTIHPDGRVVYYPFPNFEEEFSRSPAVVNLTIDDTVIGNSDSTTLRWTAVGATICYGSWHNNGNSPISHTGTYVISNLSQNSYDYTLTCNDLTGMEHIETVDLQVYNPASVSLTIGSTLIRPTGSTSLSWSISGAASCTGVASGMNKNGVQTLSGLSEGSYLYRLNCVDLLTNQSINRAVVLDVVGTLNINSFTINGLKEPVVEPGSSVTLAWNVSGVVDPSLCNINGTPLNSKVGTLTVNVSGAETSANYVINCSNEFNETDTDNASLVTSHIFLIQTSLRGNDVWSRMVPINGGILNWSNSSEWYNPYTTSSLPGSGTIQAFDEYISGGNVIQLLWRNNIGYERRVPLNSDGELNFEASPGWSQKVTAGQFPGSGNMQTLYTSIVEGTLFYVYTRGDTVYSIVKDNVGTVTSHNWEANNSGAWNVVASLSSDPNKYPGTGSFSTWTRYNWPGTMRDGLRRSDPVYTRAVSFSNGVFDWANSSWSGPTSYTSSLPGSGTLYAQSGFVVNTNVSPFVMGTHSLVELTGNREQRPERANSVSSSVAHLTSDRVPVATAVTEVAQVGPQPFSSSKVLARTADGVLGALDNITLNLTDEMSYKRYTQWTYTLGGAGTSPTPNESNLVGWWQVDLGGAHRIDRIRIYNKGNSADLNGLTVSVTGGGANWQHVHSGAINGYIDIDVGSEIGEVVRLETAGGGNFLAMADVEIYGNLALAEPDVTVRKTYSLAGQPIATRVIGHEDSSQNGLFYIYTDHLGSASNMTDRFGKVVDTQRYLPFGEQRTAPKTTITERGFTGHHENRDIGLTYMNARFYVLGIGRFATADIIVPDSTEPQDFNRYSYVRNNPIRYNDPSGHCIGVLGGVDTLACVFAVGLLMAVSYIANDSTEPSIEITPAQSTDGPPNTASFGESASASMIVGASTERTTTVHFDDDSIATAVCNCTTLSTNAEVSVSSDGSLGWTDFTTAADVADGRYVSYSGGASIPGSALGGQAGVWYAAKEPDNLWYGSSNDLLPVVSEQPGTTGYSVGLTGGVSSLPISITYANCQCSVVEDSLGPFDPNDMSSGIPLWVFAANAARDEYTSANAD